MVEANTVLVGEVGKDVVLKFDDVHAILEPSRRLHMAQIYLQRSVAEKLYADLTTALGK